MTPASLLLWLRNSIPTLDRYIFHQLFVALLATTGGLAALIWLMQSLHFVSLVVDRGLSLGVFIKLTSLLVPSFVAVILPITTFVVSLFVYQRLAGDRELTVMRAAGLSPFATAKPGVSCAIMATICGFLLNLWIVPHSYHAFRAYEFQIRNKMAAFMLQEGVFTKVSDVMTVYIRSRSHDGTLHGIMVEDDRQPDRHATILANHGTLVVVDDVPRVILYDGSRQVINKQTGRLDMLVFKEDTMDLTSQKQAESRSTDAAEMSLSMLLHPDPELVSERDTGKFKVEGWRRLTSPLTCFSFAMVGLFAVLRGVFSRHGNIKRPLGAILAVVGLLACNLVLQNLASRNTSLIPLIPVLALLPGLICSAILFGPERAKSTKAEMTS
ncbi:MULTISPECIES: LPS export ABC transporter permease LptF [Acetobacter]|uniref:LPS export ABC transporter permease LptF n=1 Tax=Acetobacter TaxID=434 RepID=UPI000A392AF6|nr:MULTISPECIES: LPS export ABC transporter permease LptF [Acetobacter]MBS0960127.1 LPS export ABC transporter permease LptF [Acetobacter thailandicus]MBS0979457.1 LPS export ABC transporter permease LptF [Acetobacter thailandicus]MBS0985661.1 LPS export ABC transporter permease LptF [Acetobacter thailandicus]MBS1002575.1 LPS export ABC transporter permease LptF [Acetobacter thailandicus]OUI88503.1 transporter [Acetobacter sp. DmW_043]